FLGVPHYYSHPVIRPGAAHYAAMAAESAGFRRFVLTAKFDRDAAPGKVLFSGDETERLAEYCEWHGEQRHDTRLLQLWTNGNHELLELAGLLPHPMGGTTIRERTTPKVLAVIKQYPASFPHDAMLHGHVPTGFIRWCRTNLHRMLGN